MCVRSFFFSHNTWHKNFAFFRTFLFLSPLFRRMSIHFLSLSLSLSCSSARDAQRELVSLSLSLFPPHHSATRNLPLSSDRSSLHTERERHNSAKDEICGRETEREKRERGRCVREKLTKKVKRGSCARAPFFLGAKVREKHENCRRTELKLKRAQGERETMTRGKFGLFEFFFFFFAFFSRALPPFANSLSLFLHLCVSRRALGEGAFLSPVRFVER